MTAPRSLHPSKGAIEGIESFHQHGLLHTVLRKLSQEAYKPRHIPAVHNGNDESHVFSPVHATPVSSQGDQFQGGEADIRLSEPR